MRPKAKRGIPPTISETGYESKQRERKEAQAIAEKFKNIKPTKYLLK
jgi:hypothetical protein